MDPIISFTTQAGLTWDWKVAFDLFFGGLGIGAILLAIFIDRYYGESQKALARSAARLGPISILIGLFFLLLKMGRPWQLYLTYFSFAPTSPIWWGAWLQLAVLVLGFMYARKFDAETSNLAERMKFSLPLAILAILVGAYHGYLFAVIHAQALWNTGAMIMSALLIGIATGIAASLAMYLNGLDKQERTHALQELKAVRLILAASLAAQLVTTLLWWTELSFGSLASQNALQPANSSWGPAFWLLSIVLGLLVPLWMERGILLKPGAEQATPQTSFMTSSLLILLGGFIFRLAIIMGGQAGPIIQTLT